MTGNATVETAVGGAPRRARWTYLVKPIDRARLAAFSAHVARTRELKQESRTLRDELRDLGRFGPMWGRSAAMQEVYDLIERVAPRRPVFVTGESGRARSWWPRRFIV